MVGAFWGKIHSFGKMVNGNSSIQVAVALEEDGYESASALIVTYEN